MNKLSSINLGVIGCGYWGPNLVRNFSSLPNCNVSIVSDLKKGRLEFIKSEFPFLQVTTNYETILNNKRIDAVCIATPVKTHHLIVEEALKAGKHVFVEKPMAAKLSEASSMVDIAEKFNRKIAVGHVFQFAPGVRKIKEMINKGIIGDVLYIDSMRINLGPPKTEVDVIWDLGPHDFSIILYLLEEFPEKVNTLKNFYRYGFSKNDTKKLTNNANIDLIFKSGKSAHIHLSWLSSNKTRFMQIFGSEGTIIYDEMLALDGKVKLYGRGVDNRIGAKDSDSKVLSYQSGDIQIIKLEQHEPLRLECQHFIDSIIYNKPFINGSKIGYDVVKLLEEISNHT